jgi:hypothetical protein
MLAVKICFHLCLQQGFESRLWPGGADEILVRIDGDRVEIQTRYVPNGM